jgi:hypothetical protein
LRFLNEDRDLYVHTLCISQNEFTVETTQYIEEATFFRHTEDVMKHYFCKKIADRFDKYTVTYKPHRKELLKMCIDSTSLSQGK